MSNKSYRNEDVKQALQAMPADTKMEMFNHKGVYFKANLSVPQKRALLFVLLPYLSHDNSRRVQEGSLDAFMRYREQAVEGHKQHDMYFDIMMELLGSRFASVVRGTLQKLASCVGQESEKNRTRVLKRILTIHKNELAKLEKLMAAGGQVHPNDLRLTAKRVENIAEDIASIFKTWRENGVTLSLENQSRVVEFLGRSIANPDINRYVPDKAFRYFESIVDICPNQTSVLLHMSARILGKETTKHRNSKEEKISAEVRELLGERIASSLDRIAVALVQIKEERPAKYAEEVRLLGDIVEALADSKSIFTPKKLAGSLPVIAKLLPEEASLWEDVEAELRDRNDPYVDKAFKEGELRASKIPAPTASAAPAFDDR